MDMSAGLRHHPLVVGTRETAENILRSGRAHMPLTEVGGAATNGKLHAHVGTPAVSVGLGMAYELGLRGNHQDQLITVGRLRDIDTMLYHGTFKSSAVTGVAGHALAGLWPSSDSRRSHRRAHHACRRGSAAGARRGGVVSLAPPPPLPPTS